MMMMIISFRQNQKGSEVPGAGVLHDDGQGRAFPLLFPGLRDAGNGVPVWTDQGYYNILLILF